MPAAFRWIPPEPASRIPGSATRRCSRAPGDPVVRRSMSSGCRPSRAGRRSAVAPDSRNRFGRGRRGGGSLGVAKSDDDAGGVSVVHSLADVRLDIRGHDGRRGASRLREHNRHRQEPGDFQPASPSRGLPGVEWSHRHGESVLLPGGRPRFRAAKSRKRRRGFMFSNGSQVGFPSGAEQEPTRHRNDTCARPRSARMLSL